MHDETDPVADGLIPPSIASSPTAVAAYGVSRAAAGREADLIATVAATVDRIRADTGCEQYAVHRLLDETGSLLFYERWATGAELVDHVRQPYMASFWGAVVDLLDGPFVSNWVLPLDS